jgi:hypothetical protein
MVELKFTTALTIAFSEPGAIFTIEEVAKGFGKKFAENNA